MSDTGVLAEFLNTGHSPEGWDRKNRDIRDAPWVLWITSLEIRGFSGGSLTYIVVVLGFYKGVFFIQSTDKTAFFLNVTAHFFRQSQWRIKEKWRAVAPV
ncbi:hypothetical protein BaRGS_00014456 [Batillaria attramentaria]|uniref:Uncharacterized protein n=1 Tax=Batillaria attramentaria TaxID=370345 RepID=A0ABD0L4Y4_9CAEN